MKTKWILIVVIAAGLLLGACSTTAQEQNSQPAAQGDMDQARIEKGQAGAPTQVSESDPEQEVHSDTISSLSDGEATSAELEGLIYMREEEKLARDVYLQLGGQWDFRAFENIASSESTHMDAVLGLIQLFGAEDPVGDNPPGVFEDQELQALYSELVERGNQSLPEALLVGGAIEEIDILDLQEYLAGTQDAAIREVYGNLLQGSINHLASFARTYERQTGESYQPQYLTQQTYLDLISQAAVMGSGGGSRGMNASPQGRGGGRQ
jgi:hypothetical protein